MPKDQNNTEWLLELMHEATEEIEGWKSWQKQALGVVIATKANSRKGGQIKTLAAKTA